jgi:hypothetical protein
MNNSVQNKAEQLLFDFHEALYFEYPFYPVPGEEESLPVLSRFALTSAGGDTLTYWGKRRQLDLAGEFMRGEISNQEYLEKWNVVHTALSMHK